MRSSPSSSDLELLEALASDGSPVSRYQLERWRNHGLLARPWVTRHPARGSSVDPPDEIDFLTATVLHATVRRGTSWQVGGLALFEEGLHVSEDCLRKCAVWVIEAPQRQMESLWRQAVGSRPIAALDDEDALGDVAELAAQLSRTHRATRKFHAQVRMDLSRLKIYDRKNLEHRSHLALGLRLADICGADLSVDLLHVAKYGSPNAPVPDYPYALFSEKRLCGQTLTLREGYAMRRVMSPSSNSSGTQATSLTQVCWSSQYWSLPTPAHPNLPTTRPAMPCQQ